MRTSAHKRSMNAIAFVSSPASRTDVRVRTDVRLARVSDIM